MSSTGHNITSPETVDVVTESVALPASRSESHYLWLRQTCRAVALLLAAFQAWSGRYAMGTDAISYLDMGDAYWRGDWSTAINGLWSPLYGIALGLAIKVVQPSPAFEYPLVHIVNFLIFLATLVCFEFFLRELVASIKASTNTITESLPEWALLALGYGLFIWSSIGLITLWRVNPDMCVAAIVYCASGLVLRVRRGEASYRTFIALGLVLGIGYLAKAAIFPMAFIFLGVALVVQGNLRKAISRVSLALLAFLIVAAPLVIALSVMKGRPTYSDAGKLNYVWFVSRTTIHLHWQGDPPGSGTPVHPTRKIFGDPPVYEFATPVGGTYPPWYDPSYWYEGATMRFNLRGQLMVIEHNVRPYWDIFFQPPRGLIGIAIVLIYFAVRKWLRLKSILKQWPLLIPALAAIGMHALLPLEGRYVAPYVVLIWVAMLAAVQIPREEQKKGLFLTSCLMLVFLVTGLGFSAVRESRKAMLYWSEPHLEVVQALDRIGVKPGDQCASIGRAYAAYWARLKRVRIIAEIPDQYAEGFWLAKDSVKSEVYEKFAATGARFIISDLVPPGLNAGGWEQIANTEFYLRRLDVTDQ
jgi:hypothetical protein